MVQFILILILSIAISGKTDGAHASTLSCLNLFDRKTPRIVFSNELEVLKDPFEQWLLWEAQANINKFRKSINPVPFDYVTVSRAKVEVWRGKNERLQSESKFLNRWKVKWLKHKFNKSAEAPFIEIEQADGQIYVRLTASRSVVIPELRLSLKTATDNPHPDSNETETEKLDTHEDVQLLRVRYDYINKIDENLSQDPDLVLLKEPLAFIEKSSGTAIIFRDLAPLDDGHYYLPALSLPYVGDSIARLHGSTFFEFWQRHYIEALGRTKAKLLLRYGLQMVTPNPQNFLIQLDKNLMPTGVIVVRDYTDSDFYGPVARAKKLNEPLSNALDTGDKIAEKLKPYFRNSILLFDEAPGFEFPILDQDRWEHAHDLAFAEEIETLLRTRFLKKTILSGWIKNIINFIASPSNTVLSQTEAYLNSKEGQKRIRKLFAYTSEE